LIGDLLANELRFECLECGKCCNSEIIVSYLDIRKLMLDSNLIFKIQRNFIPRLIKGNLVYTTNSILGLSTKRPCAFLKDGKCLVQENKPLICKTYPFSIKPKNMQTTNQIKIIKEEILYKDEIFNLVQIDIKCPGVGKGPIVDLNELFTFCYHEYKNMQETYHF
jgi:Fe-S-cluster containining protein